MTASLPPMIRFQPLVAGAPLPGGFVYFYAAGTTTPQAAYAADGTTPLANPLTLDANGACYFLLGDSLTYKIDVQDSTGAAVTGWPVDNVTSMNRVLSQFVQLTDLASTSDVAKGDALIGVKSTLTGAAATNQHLKNTDWVSLYDFMTPTQYAAWQAAPTSYDMTTILAAAIAGCTDTGLISGVCVKALHVPAGSYLTGNQTLPAACRIIGDGRMVTQFLCKTGTTGVWFGDGGTASKFELSGLAFYGQSVAGLTYGLRFGYGATPFGTEGVLKDLFIRDIDGASAIWNFDVFGNVGAFENIAVWNGKGGIRIGGAANVARALVSYGMSVKAVDLDLCHVDGLEIEAPGNSCVPLYFTGNGDVNGLTVSLANSTTISHLVEFGASCTTWSVTNFKLAFGTTTAGITVSNGNFKRADGSYFGGNATAGSRAGEGHYWSDTAGQIPQAFALTITNDTGTIKHKITDQGNNGTGAWVSRINAPNINNQATPTGTDASTAMAYGGKIGSATPSIFWVDTIAAQYTAGAMLSATVSYNNTTTPVYVTFGFTAININGVTKSRLFFQFLKQSDSSAFAINTTNITNGQLLQVIFNGRLS